MDRPGPVQPTQAPTDRSVPLLKFRDDRAYLPEEGLELISQLKGYIYPVIFVGDGRSGKSCLASKVLDLEGIFKSVDSAESVTTGIDAVAVPMGKLVAECPDLGERTYNADPVDDDDMHMLVLDCEGGNNAMAAIRTLVNVFSIVIATEVVFVVGDSFSEAGLQDLGASLSIRGIIEMGESQKLQDQGLVFVVNKNTLRYTDDALEKTLNTTLADPARTEVREAIMQSFPERKFQTIPLMQMDGFEGAVQALRKQILQDRRPVEMGGVKMKGPGLAELLQVIVCEMEPMDRVHFPSMARCVIMGFLSPLAKSLCRETQARMPEVEDYDENLAKKDPRQSAFAQFYNQTAHIVERSYVAEVREDLKDQLDDAWNHVVTLNDVYGEQEADRIIETQESHVGNEYRQLGGGGMLKSVAVTYEKMRERRRTKVVKRNGREEFGDWVFSSDGETAKLQENPFVSFMPKVPLLRGKVLKRSPSLFTKIFSCGKDVFQERFCVVREGHLIWWDGREVPMPNHTDSYATARIKESAQVQGMVSFLLNRAKVEKVGEHDDWFRIMPEEPHGWDDLNGFTGGNRRELVFNVGSREELGNDFHPVNDWIEAIQTNIEFGNDVVQH